MKITVFMDNLKSWYYPHAKDLVSTLSLGHEVSFVSSLPDILPGDCAFFLSCEQIISKKVLQKNTHNIVVHSSNLPEGKGWSPLTWQILEGKNEIVNTLFEAAEKVDAGVIYMQNTMHFSGDELLSELHVVQGQKVNELIEEFVAHYDTLTPREQLGEQTFYPKRTQKDSELDPTQSIADQFNVLRVSDNEQYPAFFHYKNKKYIIKIYKAEVDEPVQPSSLTKGREEKL